MSSIISLKVVLLVVWPIRAWHQSRLERVTCQGNLTVRKGVNANIRGKVHASLAFRGIQPDFIRLILSLVGPLGGEETITPREIAFRQLGIFVGSRRVSLGVQFVGSRGKQIIDPLLRGLASLGLWWTLRIDIVGTAWRPERRVCTRSTMAEERQ